MPTNTVTAPENWLKELKVGSVAVAKHPNGYLEMKRVTATTQQNVYFCDRWVRISDGHSPFPGTLKLITPELNAKALRRSNKKLKPSYLTGPRLRDALLESAKP